MQAYDSTEKRIIKQEFNNSDDTITQPELDTRIAEKILAKTGKKRSVVAITGKRTSMGLNLINQPKGKKYTKGNARKPKLTIHHNKHTVMKAKESFYEIDCGDGVKISIRKTA